MGVHRRDAEDAEDAERADNEKWWHGRQQWHGSPSRARTAHPTPGSQNDARARRRFVPLPNPLPGESGSATVAQAGVYHITCLRTGETPVPLSGVARLSEPCANSASNTGITERCSRPALVPPHPGPLPGGEGVSNGATNPKTVSRLTRETKTSPLPPICGRCASAVRPAQRAISIARVSRRTVTLISPGKVISSATRPAILRATRNASSSPMRCASTITRTSRPAWMA